MAMDEKPTEPDSPGQFTLLDRALGGVLLLCSVALAYIALDTLAAGAISRALSGPEDQE